MQPVAFSPTAVPATAVPDAAAWAPAAVDAPADAALHTATLQAAAPPRALQSPEAPRPVEAALPLAEVAKGFALPADQLLPVTLIGLQVQAGDAWPMSAQAREARWPRRQEADEEAENQADDEARRPAPQAPSGDDPTADAGAGADARPAAFADAGLQVDDAPADWLDPLARAINERLAAPQPPAALAAAAEQWARGRCVLLVCPRAADAQDDVVPAWAFVLWPRRGARPRGPMALRFAFTGQRVEARLQWPPGGPRAWCCVRAVKQHLAHGGRQLVALDAAGAPSGPVPCEVQLGPVRATAPRWRLAGVRVDAVRRLWSTLGGQWSVLLCVCPQPLLAPGPPVAGAVVAPAATSMVTSAATCATTPGMTPAIATGTTRGTTRGTTPALEA